MKISEIGEDSFIEKVRDQVNANFSEKIVGIGDDCAVIPYKDDKLMLLSTDSLVEDIHFIKDKISPNDLGYKAVMINLSDIAAMGGKPLYVLMSIAMPKETEELWITEYLKGFQEACEESGIQLIGGDTTGSKNALFINLTIVGEVTKDNVKYRKDAKAGDIIYVTSTLGDSLAGYNLSLKGQTDASLVKKHVRPKAHFNEGEWLGQNKFVRAMMDVSDGLIQDLNRMMKASNCGADIDLEQIPLSDEFKEFCENQKWDPQQTAVTSGEEYCLLLTVDSKQSVELERQFQKQFNTSLYRIGIVNQQSEIRFFKDKQEVKIQSKGYLHF